MTYKNLNNTNISQHTIHHLSSVEYLIEVIMNSTAYLTLVMDEDDDTPKLSLISRINNTKDICSPVPLDDGYISLAIGKPNILFHCSFQPYPPVDHYISEEINLSIYIDKKDGQLHFDVDKKTYENTLERLKERKEKALRAAAPKKKKKENG